METQTRENRINTRTVKVDPRTLKLLDVNARYMRHEVFARLVDNLRRDGTLTGNTPFAWRIHDDDTRLPIGEDYLVLSGNHRVKASIEAGLSEIEVTITDDYLAPDRRKSIQLSHNALAGEDDPATLKLIYQSIQDVDLRLYTGLDDKQLDLMTNVTVAALSEASLDFQTIAMTFLPHEVEQVLEVWERARKAAAGVKGHWLTRWGDYDKAMDALEAAGQAYNVRNTATALMIVLEVFSRHIDDLTDGYLDPDGEPIAPKQSVPLLSVLPRTVSARLASKLKKLPGEDKLAALEALIDKAKAE